MRLSRAFTLIEVLVSVILISVVVLGVVKIREQSLSAAHYVKGRMKEELANTLFLGSEALKYRDEKRDAYTLLRHLGIRKGATIDLLKNRERVIHISKPLPINGTPLPIQFLEISVRGEYTGRYYRLLY